MKELKIFTSLMIKGMNELVSRDQRSFEPYGYTLWYHD